jgi:hypothetical protein
MRRKKTITIIALLGMALIAGGCTRNDAAIKKSELKEFTRALAAQYRLEGKKPSTTANQPTYFMKSI